MYIACTAYKIRRENSPYIPYIEHLREKRIHPWKLIWNPKIGGLYMFLLSQLEHFQVQNVSFRVSTVDEPWLEN